MSRLPEDILGSIFQYLTFPDLLHIEVVCAQWRGLCHALDSELWVPVVAKGWSQNINRPSELKLLGRIQSIPLSKLKKSLRGIDLTRCVEKVDYQKMLQAKLLFEKVMEEELKGEDVRFAGKYLSMYYPNWALTIAPMKASFIHYTVDARRHEIYSSELCSIKWVFRFKEHAMMDLDGAPSWISTFREDGTMHSALQDQTYTWQVCSTSYF